MLLPDNVRNNWFAFTQNVYLLAKQLLVDILQCFSIMDKTSVRTDETLLTNSCVSLYVRSHQELTRVANGRNLRIKSGDMRYNPYKLDHTVTCSNRQPEQWMTRFC